MKRFLLIALWPLAGCNSGPSSGNQPGDEPVYDTATNMYNVTNEDKGMNAAISQAKSTLHRFDSALLSNNPDYAEFAVKKKYKTADGGEHMWVAVITLVNGEYRGVVNNDAESTTEVRYGDTVLVKKSEITDWMYIDKNKLRGGYTIREIRNRLSKDERMNMDAEMGYEIED